MGIWEKNLIILIIRYFLRWLSSNEKNKKSKETKDANSKT